MIFLNYKGSVFFHEKNRTFASLILNKIIMKQALTLITFLLLLLPVWKDCSQKAVPEADNINVVDTEQKKTAFGNFLKIFEWDKKCQSGYS